jgi:hypothetical protein
MPGTGRCGQNALAEKLIIQESQYYPNIRTRIGANCGAEFALFAHAQPVEWQPK